ncbi:hypothetical protein ACKVV1_011558 [Pyricularia oryzae]
MARIKKTYTLSLLAFFLISCQPLLLEPLRPTHHQAIVVVVVFVIIVLARTVLLLVWWLRHLPSSSLVVPVVVVVVVVSVLIADHHPPEAVGLLLDDELLARVLLQRPGSSPQLQRHVGALGLELPVAKVGGLPRRVVPADRVQPLHHVELRPVALGYLDLDLYGAADVANGTTDSRGELAAGFERREHLKSDRDPPATSPPLGAFLEDAEDCSAKVVLAVDPGELGVGVERRLPHERSVFLQLHTKERVGQRGEVVVVDARVDKGGLEALERPHVRLNLVLGPVKRQAGPVRVVGRVVRHGRVDKVGDSGGEGLVGQRLADGDLVAVKGSVDKSQLAAAE